MLKINSVGKFFKKTYLKKKTFEEKKRIYIVKEVKIVLKKILAKEEKNEEINIFFN